jgi:hypothetical protein
MVVAFHAATPAQLALCAALAPLHRAAGSMASSSKTLNRMRMTRLRDRKDVERRT